MFFIIIFINHFFNKILNNYIKMPFSIIYYICCFICVYIIIIGCRIAELVISINNICSDIKLYYILSIVSFTFFVSCPILFYINGLYEKRLITILLYIAMILCFSVDGVSYFFYIILKKLNYYFFCEYI